MTKNIIETDYLVIGSGAAGLAFADVMLSESNNNLVIVDKHSKPGGHWNDAYPFVKLQQPSCTYGVNSTVLGKNLTDTTGLNKGHKELVSGSEILNYYDEVMSQKFLPSSRLRFFPNCEYIGNNTFVSLLTGEHHSVIVNKKIVDTRYSQMEVPATTPPKYEISPKVKCIPPNQLPHYQSTYSHYVIIGSGKTAVDACLWLLENGIHPDKMMWIRPRDAWFFNRANLQLGKDFPYTALESVNRELDAIIHAESLADLFTKLEAKEQLFRIDQQVIPSMFRCAILSKNELIELRKIKNVIRLGKVQSIERNQLVLSQGIVPINPNSLFIDCTAGDFALNASQKATKLVFEGNIITPQQIYLCQMAPSAALIAYVEVHYQEEKKKNDLCPIVKLPYQDIDWLSSFTASLPLDKNNPEDKKLMQWIVSSRLFRDHHIFHNNKFDDIKFLTLLSECASKRDLALSKIGSLKIP